MSLSASSSAGIGAAFLPHLAAPPPIDQFQGSRALLSCAGPSNPAQPGKGTSMTQYISLLSVVHALKERSFGWSCVAMSTTEPLPVGPNRRVLRDCVPKALMRSVRTPNHPQPA